MITEIYKKNDQEFAEGLEKFEEQITEQAVEEKLALLKELGLEGQIALIENSRLLSKFPYRQMTEQEWLIWSMAFPTGYVKDRSEIFREFSFMNQWNRKSLEQYRFDRIPMVVLQEWAECKRNNLFDEYSIRTPERMDIDPILIGFLRRFEFPFLIARWGEALKPFSEIVDMANRNTRNGQEIISMSQQGDSRGHNNLVFRSTSNGTVYGTYDKKEKER